MKAFVIVLAAASLWGQAERKVDPTFLRQYVPGIAPQAADVTTETCQYKPIFGGGVARGVVRFAEIDVAKGSCNPVSYPAEEQVYVILEGDGTVQYGDSSAPLKRHDFLYLPAGVKHGVSGSLRLYVMGFRVAPNTPPPPKLLIANFDDIQKQTVGGHPDSVVYQLMMGDTKSTRDRIAAGHLLTSLYVMEFAPGGTNFPHHHDAEEEIYVLLDGEGDMVAGSGMDGVEARFPVKPGDAYFFRLNCTVGFYNGRNGPAHILAVRSLYPRRGN